MTKPNSKKKCNNPEPSAMYSKDEFKNICIYCENCGQEIISIQKAGEKKFKWVHVHIEKRIIYD